MKNIKFWQVGQSLAGTIAAAILLASSPLDAATTGTAYSISIKSSIPAGGSGATKPSASSPSGSLMQWPSLTYTPCLTSTPPDLISFSITYNAGQPGSVGSKSTLKDVYLILIRPDNTFYTVSKNQNGLAMTPAPDATAITAGRSANMYLPAAQNPGGTIGPEYLISQSIHVDGQLTGTLQLVGIIADSAKVDFDDPSTWIAFDTASVIMGAPWPLNAAAAQTTNMPPTIVAGTTANGISFQGAEYPYSAPGTHVVGPYMFSTYTALATANDVYRGSHSANPTNVGSNCQ